jgi:hypothetical protein
MSRAPKRVWWCPIENKWKNEIRINATVQKIRAKISGTKYKYKELYELDCYRCRKCTAKPYVPEKGGER